MIILKLLSEEIFDFYAEQMTQAKTKTLKQTMCNEFSEIFKLCNEVLENANKPSLIKATLETLLRFLNWIPLGYIFETQIIDYLVTRVSRADRMGGNGADPKFLEVAEFRNVTLKCLSEIAGLNIGPEYNSKFTTLFQVVMTSVNRMVPPSTGESRCRAKRQLILTADIKAAYATADDEDQQLINNLALFLTNYLNSHLRLIETPDNKELLINAHLYLIKISTVDDREVFKICLEYWSKVRPRHQIDQRTLMAACG